MVGKWMVPGNVLAFYFLGGNDFRSKADEMYYLCIGRDFRIFCLVHNMPNDMYSKAWWSDPIDPADFSNHTVEEGNIDELAREKLAEILPHEK